MGVRKNSDIIAISIFQAMYCTVYTVQYSSCHKAGAITVCIIIHSTCKYWIVSIPYTYCKYTVVKIFQDGTYTVHTVNTDLMFKLNYIVVKFGCEGEYPSYWTRVNLNFGSFYWL